MYFNNINDLQELRDRFRKLAMENHPDHGGNTETMQTINAEYKKAFDFIVHNSGFSDGRISYETELDPILREKIEVLLKIKNIFIEICGNWLWVTGDTKPVKDVLKENELKFSGKKLAWYWHSGNYRKKSKRQLSLDEIRDLYGSDKIQKDDTQLQLT